MVDNSLIHISIRYPKQIGHIDRALYLLCESPKHLLRASEMLPQPLSSHQNVELKFNIALGFVLCPYPLRTHSKFFKSSGRSLSAFLNQNLSSRRWQL